MKSPFLLIAASALVLSACGKPELKIDSSQVEASAGATPVGLLEVHRANSGGAMGVPVGESLSESAFCAATVVGEDKIVTSSDCVRSGSDVFDPSKMEFHLNAPGTQKTETWDIASVRRLKGVAYITLKSSIDEEHAPAKLGLLASSLPIGDTQKEMAAKIVFLPAPDKEGLAVATLVDTTIQYSAQGFIYEKTYTGNPHGPSQRKAGGYQNGYNGQNQYGGRPYNGSQGGYGNGYGQRGNPNAGFPGNNGYGNNGNTNPSCTGDCNPNTQTITETVSTSFSANMQQAGTLGSPVVVNGQVVGVVSNPGSQPGVDNLRWLDPRGEQSSLQPGPKPVLPAPSPKAPSKPVGHSPIVH